MSLETIAWSFLIAAIALPFVCYSNRVRKAFRMAVLLGWDGRRQ